MFQKWNRLNNRRLAGKQSHSQKDIHGLTIQDGIGLKMSLVKMTMTMMMTMILNLSIDSVSKLLVYELLSKTKKVFNANCMNWAIQFFVVSYEECWKSIGLQNDANFVSFSIKWLMLIETLYLWA